ncbi:MAG TPA: flagellin, partial [Paracoccaceae bacterium]|nr:flagellin [Paracoccaceae bacterium]
AASAMIAPAAREATSAFEAAVAALNTRLGDRSLFAGVATDGPALAPARDILDAIALAAAAETTAAGVEAAVGAWFADPAGFAAQFLGGAPRAPLLLSSEDTATLAVTALDPALRDTLASLALGALIDRGTPPLPDAERGALAQRAGERLLAGQTARAELQAAVGTQEGRIAAAARRNTAETAALEIARAGLLSVDPADTATRLQATQTQLETLYAVTVRLSRLSLADFLR